MPPPPPHAGQLALVDAAFRSLPERYLGSGPEFDATYHVRLGDLGHTWEVRCTSLGARVRKGATRREPDVTISTDADTWMRLREGEFSGVDAFQRRRLAVRGNLDHAVAFEGMFRLPNNRPPLLQIRDVPVGRHRVSTLTMGRGRDVLLVHGLGGTRASMFDTASALSRRYRVHAVDLPGFGSSSKPARGGYNARWFAEILLGLMDELEIGSARVVGNSMGGRIGIEMGLCAPDRVSALGLLCPAVVWGSHDPLVPAAYGRHVARWLPSAEQVTIDQCGHVPQVERAEECNDLLMGFFARAERANTPSRRLPRWEVVGDEPTGLGARYRMLMRIGSSKLVG